MPLLTLPETLTRHGADSWHWRAAQEVAERLGTAEFPCLFAQNAFRRDLVRFSFIEELDGAGLKAAEQDLTRYLERSAAWDGKVNSAEPLLMLFNPQAVQAETLEGWHAIGWQVLQHLHDHDPMPWPEDTSLSPHSPFWSMAYCGTEIFVNMSCPAHRIRRSRHLGSGLVLVINPRERFDIVAGDTPEGRRTRAKIRARVGDYDGLPHSPQLGSYVAGEIEWWQYGIIEENRERTDRCPFSHRALRDGLAQGPEGAAPATNAAAPEAAPAAATTTTTAAAPPATERPQAPKLEKTPG